MAKGAGESLIGRTIAGKYAVEALLGSGAMGEVYRARQVALEKTVALKVMHSDIAADPSFAARFHREAKAASRLDHPNSIRVIDFGEEPDGLTYIAMEFVDGRDLLKLITSEWPLSAARISGILMQALGALAVAHEMGVVHRDLKPENIMIIAGTDDEGRPTDIVKVCDFGIAKITAKSHKKGSNGPDTTQGMFVGTPEYVSPEQGKGESIDSRSDLYSMGVILFQLLTGKVPFEADNPIGIVLKHVTDDPPRPSQLNPAIDRRLEAICLKAMRKRREDRYQTAKELRAELRVILGDVGVPFDRGSTAVLTPGPMSSQRISDLRAGQRETPDGAAHATTLKADSVPAPPEARSAGTPSGTMALPEIPVEGSRWTAVALVIGLLAVGGVGLSFAFRGRHAAPPTDTVTASSPPSDSAPLVASSAPVTRSAPNPEAIIPATPSIVPAASASSASVRAPPGPPAGRVGSSARSSGGQALVAAVRAVDPPSPDPAVPAPSYNPTTAGATVQVMKATGASVQAVKAALPSWNYTTCYQDGLRKAKKRVEGRTVLQLTFASSGFFTKVNGATSTAELTGVANCVFQATLSSGSLVQNADPAGGTAEVVVTYTPE
jgi:serine/threonine-protein kinase